MSDAPEHRCEASDPTQWCELKVLLPPHLYRSWHRCSWMLVNETGRSRLDIMQEMVTDFLQKHGC